MPVIYPPNDEFACIAAVRIENAGLCTIPTMMDDQL
jgi:hypothetical protein